MMDSSSNNFGARTRGRDDNRPLISGLLAIIGTGAVLIFATLVVLNSPVVDRSASLPNAVTDSQPSIQEK